MVLLFSSFVFVVVTANSGNNEIADDARQERAKKRAAANVVAAFATPSETSSPKKSNVSTSHVPGGGRGKHSTTTAASPVAKQSRPKKNDKQWKTSNLVERRKGKLPNKKDTPVEPHATTHVDSLAPSHILRDFCKCVFANFIIMNSHSC